MKFFLDENFPKNAVKYLKERNHKVIDLRGTEQEGLDDNSIFELAQKESAIFLTTDLDFFHTIPYKFVKHHGFPL